jgi:hypothetical protein
MLKTLLLSALATFTAAQVSPCGGDMTDVEAQLYPEILTVGEGASLYLRYDAPYKVVAGTTKTTFNFNGVPYPEMDGKLCSDDFGAAVAASSDDVAAAANTFDLERYYQFGAVACPITVGVHESNDSFSVPNVGGQLKSKVQWFSESGALLLCLKFLITIEDAAAAVAAA